MGRLCEPLRFLSSQDMQRIHETACRILEEVGMRVDHPDALDRLRKRGCRVDHDSGRVRVPREVTERSVGLMRDGYAQPDRRPREMAVRYSRVLFRTEPHRVHPDFTVSTGGFCCFIHDLEGRRRPATIQDVRDALRLVNALDEIGFAGLPVAAQEVPHPLRPVTMAAELVKRTRKLGGIETYCVRDAEYITRIAEVVAGSPEELRRHPVLVGYAEARSPLCFDRNMVEVFMAYVERGLPQTLDTMPSGGMTAPVTAAGTLAQGVAESMMGLVLAHAIDEQAVVGLDVNASYADMRTGLFSYAMPERWPLLGARLQLLGEYYGCPAGVHGGKTDACVPGVQVGVEKTASLLMPVLCGAVAVGTVGHLENALTFSPEQLVIDDAIVSYVRRAIRGIDVTDETLGLDAVAEAAPAGEFLSHKHTTEHFRQELQPHPLFDRAAWGQAYASDAPGMQAAAREKARAILAAEDSPPPLSPDQEAAVDEIVREATMELGE